MNDGGGKLCREPAPVDSARVHEAVERILAERHGGALEMHLRVDGTLLEHHAENQQEDAKDRDAAKLVRICRTEDATDLIAMEKDLHFLRESLINSATHLHTSALSSRRRQILDVAPLRLWFVSLLSRPRVKSEGRRRLGNGSYAKTSQECKREARRMIG